MWGRLVEIEVVEGNLLEQKVDAIVNAWNRNIIPWWLLIPQGVSGAIKRRAGYAPFWEPSKIGVIPLGEAVVTCAGKLPYKGIIHVAGINMLWRSSEWAIRECTRHAVIAAADRKWSSIAMPIIGSGTGGFEESQAASIIIDELKRMESILKVIVVKYVPKKSG